MPVFLSESCQQLLEEQGGVIARWQAPAVGLDPSLIDRRLRQGRWQPLYRGIYATFTGRPERESHMWGAVLRAGPGAALSYQTAAELDGLTDTRITAIHVTVSSQQQFKVSGAERSATAPRVIVHRSARLATARHPVRVPPRTRVEETVLDLAEASACFDDALAWTVAACERRRTTHIALLTAMGVRPRMRWRAELTAALDDIGGGAHSVLEFRYVRGVERPHGLPAGRRQARQSRGSRSNYLDTPTPFTRTLGWPWNSTAGLPTEPGIGGAMRIETTSWPPAELSPSATAGPTSPSGPVRWPGRSAGPSAGAAGRAR